MNLDYERYKVPYICYNNFGLEKNNLDMEAYQVSNYLLKLSNNKGGRVTNIHELFNADDKYQSYLELLTWDILNGEGYIYQNKPSYQNVNTEYGLLPFFCSDVTIVENECTLITGSGFNEFCRVKLNGRDIDVTYQDSHNLLVHTVVRENDSLEIYRKGLYRTIGESIKIGGKK